MVKRIRNNRMIFRNNQLEFAHFSYSIAEKFVKEHPQSLLAQNRAKRSRYSNRAVTYSNRTDTIEMSVLGHYLPSSLSSFRNCVNFIQNNFTMSKSQCKRIFDLAAAISISSSRRIFMAKSCQEWCVDF